jgi:hypothetical protein
MIAAPGAIDAQDAPADHGGTAEASANGSSIKKTYKGHSQEPPTLVVKWMETLSRDVTWLRSDAFKKICCGAGLFKMQRFEIF